MSKLERVIYELDSIEQTKTTSSGMHRIDARAKLLTLFVYLICMLSLPTQQWSRMMLFLIFPMVVCWQTHFAYGKLFIRSLVIVPFVALVGIFNPWPSFVGILIRGLASVQGVFVLIQATGFHSLCRGLQGLGVPSLFVSQLLFVYRYLTVLLQETLTMQYAREARSFGRKVYTFKQWGTFAGQLLLRTLDRSSRIHQAMMSRGFDGTFPHPHNSHWSLPDSLYLLMWSAVFLTLRFIPINFKL